MFRRSGQRRAGVAEGLGDERRALRLPPPGRTTPPSLPCTATLTTPPSQSNPSLGTPPTAPTRSLGFEPVSPLPEPHTPTALPTSPVPIPEPVLTPEPASLLEPTATPTSPKPTSHRHPLHLHILPLSHRQHLWILTSKPL
jgi:hypothetical protein